LLGLAVAYGLRPVPVEMASRTMTVLLVACPLAALAYLLAGFLVGRPRTGGAPKNRSVDAQRLGQITDEAESADRQTTNFFIEANHAIRTPLNAIIGYSEMIIEDGGEAFNEQHLEDMQRIHQATEQLLKLVSDVFDLAAIERRPDVAAHVAEMNAPKG
jgi:signal transduction histidine kinase